jgi:hypothetical protein
VLILSGAAADRTPSRDAVSRLAGCGHGRNGPLLRHGLRAPGLATVDGMYLVHLHLRRADGSPPTSLPGPTGPAVRAAAWPADGVEHVAVHDDARPHPVLGVFLVADRLEDAEAGARRAWEHARDRHPWLREWTLVQAAVPLIAPLYEGLPDATDLPGRNRPGPFPST